jgi:hypothetical protein
MPRRVARSGSPENALPVASRDPAFQLTFEKWVRLKYSGQQRLASFDK